MSLQHVRGAYLHRTADEPLLHLLLGVCQIAHFSPVVWVCTLNVLNLKYERPSL